MEFQAVLDAVRSLPVGDQVRLVDHLKDDWQAHANGHDLTPAQIMEIERRLAAYDADPTIGIPWEEFEAHIDKRLIQDDMTTQDLGGILTPEQMQELDRRLADIDASPDDGFSWEEVLAEARARHKR